MHILQVVNLYGPAWLGT